MNPELLRLVKRINDHVNKFPDNDTGTGQLLVTLYDYMEPFSATTPAEMNALCNQYSGFYRFAKLLEQMASGISDGTIDVPKDH